MLHKWPNNANRTAYPSHMNLSSTPPITKPVPLNKEIFERYDIYIKEYDALLQKKQNLDEKASKIIIELDAAESVKGGHAWSRKDNNKGLIKRLQADSETVKNEILIDEKKIDTLTMANSTLVSLVSIHKSCVKGYEDYLVWKDETESLIYEIIMNNN
jgi:hypothetical protein